MSEKTINEHIQDQIDYTINRILFPRKCRITKVYTENNYVDIEFEDEGDTLTYIQAIGSHITVEATGVVIFLNNSSDVIVIT